MDDQRRDAPPQYPSGSRGQPPPVPGEFGSRFIALTTCNIQEFLLNLVEIATKL
jgi:hypothetical protein